MVTPAARREAVQRLREGWGRSERRACELAGVSRSVVRYRCRARVADGLRERLLELAASKPRYGSPLLYKLLRREGRGVNHKRVERLYRLEGLSLRRQRRKRVAAARREAAAVPSRPNERWSMDFMSDALGDGRRFRLLNVLDDFSRESLAIEVDRSLPAERVIAVLERLVKARGAPQRVVIDNGPEFTSQVLDAWAARGGIELHFIRPGRPVENCFVESFNGTLRRECLDSHWFWSIEEARAVLEAWRREYNGERPHGSLGDLPPAEFAALQSPTAPYEPQTPLH